MATEAEVGRGVTEVSRGVTEVSRQVMGFAAWSWQWPWEGRQCGELDERCCGQCEHGGQEFFWIELDWRKQSQELRGQEQKRLQSQ